MLFAVSRNDKGSSDAVNFPKKESIKAASVLFREPVFPERNRTNLGSQPASFRKRYHVKMIEDAWGKMHPVESVDMILTTSQFKAFDWFRDCGRDWNDYWKDFKKYNHEIGRAHV